MARTLPSSNGNNLRRLNDNQFTEKLAEMLIWRHSFGGMPNAAARPPGIGLVRPLARRRRTVHISSRQP